MRVDLQIKKHNDPELAMGTGFVALDIVEGRSSTFGAAGGSCGNVMAMLAWLGWNSVPVGRLGTDAAGDYVVEEFEAFSVDTSALTRDERMATPIVIQRFSETKNGERTHRFSLSCPGCGGWLPRFRSLTIDQARPVMESDYKPRVFYFDRVSPASLRLARWARDTGALVLFEPSSVGDEKPFQQAVEVCHVLKYSHDRLGHVPDLATARGPQLVVETLGANGLRMRWGGEWCILPAFQVPRFEDAAGSGDWCSAGFLHIVGAKGSANFEQKSKLEIERALKFGQSLATLNCRFEGARGLMTYMDLSCANKALRKLSETGSAGDLDWSEGPDRQLPEKLCSVCRPPNGRVSKTRKSIG